MSASRSARVRRIHARLARAHGPLDPPRRMDPIDELILTILSQNTSDVNRDRAWTSMRRRYPTWERLSRASELDLVEAIRAGGLANTKAPRILAVLRSIREREGKLDLSWMREATDDEIRTYLGSLPGVGPKTVACVLAFSLGRDTIPVDTHVHRVATRLGLLPEGTGAASAHEVLESVVPARLRVPLHVALIRHGRRICKPGRPWCERCVLQDICPTASKYVGQQGHPARRPTRAALKFSGKR